MFDTILLVVVALTWGWMGHRVLKDSKRLASAEERINQLVAVVGGGEAPENVGLLAAPKDAEPEPVLTKPLRFSATKADVAAALAMLEQVSLGGRYDAFRAMHADWKNFTPKQISKLLDCISLGQRGNATAWYYSHRET